MLVVRDWGSVVRVSVRCRAGDLVAQRDLSRVLAVARAEDDALMPADRQAVFEILPPGAADVSVPAQTGTYADGVPQGLDIEGLAWVDERLFGIDVWGKVYEFDLESRTVEEHDDLSSSVPDYMQGLKTRGATGVVLPD